MRDDDMQNEHDETADEALILDARGLRCPLPLLKTRQALARMQPGERVRVLATDAGSVRDFRSYAAISGNRLCQFKEYDDIYEYLIEKSSQD